MRATGLHGMADQSSPANRPETGREAAGKPPLVANHTLLSLIARGSYGEVWLARSELGQMRAVKLVFRNRFADSKPYERELAGIKRFEPISREHEGFVDVLQVGVNEGEGFFFYVMELADPAPTEAAGSQGSATSDQPADLGCANSAPPAYSATTLLSEIHRLGRLPLGRALALGIQLAGALDYLHQRGLVHRDIKPSNIIFVNGQPKLADVGLVADLGDPRSFVGTEGYIPPEGPGTVRADLYSLGKVLYEAATGKDRHDFPRLGTALDAAAAAEQAPEGQAAEGGVRTARNDSEDLLELNEVLLRCCQQDPRKRYANAAAMLADLRVLDAGVSLRKARRVRHSARAIAAIAVLAILIVFGGLAIRAAVMRYAMKPRLLQPVRFEGPGLDTNLWNWSHVDLGIMSTGKRTHEVEALAGQLVIKTAAEATSEDGLTIVGCVWADLKMDLKPLAPCSITLDLRGESEGGLLAVAISDGTSPNSHHDPAGVALVRLNAYQASARISANGWAPRKIRIDLPAGSQAAVVYPDADRLDEFDVVGLEALAHWHLRFFCSASTSSGFISGHSTLRVGGFDITSHPGGPTMVGRVVESISGWEVSDAIVSDESGRTLAKSASHGAILFTNLAGGEITVGKTGFQPGKLALPLASARSPTLEFPLRKISLKVGDPIAVIPYGNLPASGIGFWGNRLWICGGSDEIGCKLVAVDAQRKQIDAASPPFLIRTTIVCFAECGQRLIGLNWWPGRMYDLTSQSAEEPFPLMRPEGDARMSWPYDCAYDGSLLWFVEADCNDERFFLHGLDLEKKTIVHSLKSGDRLIRGLAWDGKQFWVSSEKGTVFAVNREKALEKRSLAFGMTGEDFRGNYRSLAFGEGSLWGLDTDRRRICKIHLAE